MHRISHTTRFQLLMFLLLQACGSNDDPVDPNTRLCGGEAGLALRITGPASPVEFCLDDPDVSTAFTSESRYDIRATRVIAGVTHDIQMIVAHHDNWPLNLAVTGDLSVALADPGSVWIFYQEIPPSGDALKSVAATGGPFRLTFSDASVAVATSSAIDLEMETVPGGNAAGARRIETGFLSLAVSP